jgi:hypothetical protein
MYPYRIGVEPTDPTDLSQVAFRLPGKMPGARTTANRDATDPGSTDSKTTDPDDFSVEVNGFGRSTRSDG